MAELQKPELVATDNRTQQQKHFDEVYAVFFSFYQEALRNDPPPHEKVKLLLTTRFFDDVKLQKVLHPMFARFTTTVDEKRAIARAAYYDALTIHNRLAGVSFVSVSEKEKHDL